MTEEYTVMAGEIRKRRAGGRKVEIKGNKTGEEKESGIE